MALRCSSTPEAGCLFVINKSISLVGGRYTGVEKRDNAYSGVEACIAGHSGIHSVWVPFYLATGTNPPF
jgi:hypothetical protein